MKSPLNAARLTALSAAAVLAAGCTAPSAPQPSPARDKMQPIGMPNPASAYCVQKGGTLSMRKDAAGNESGWCTLPDGTVIEEWALFRRDHPAPTK